MRCRLFLKFFIIEAKRGETLRKYLAWFASNRPEWFITFMISAKVFDTTKLCLACCENIAKLLTHCNIFMVLLLNIYNVFFWTLQLNIWTFLMLNTKCSFTFKLTLNERDRMLLRKDVFVCKVLISTQIQNYFPC